MERDARIKLIYEIITAQVKSDLTIKEFCNRKNIPYETFLKWRAKFLNDGKFNNEYWIKCVDSKVYRTNNGINATEGIIKEAIVWLKINMNDL